MMFTEWRGAVAAAWIIGTVGAIVLGAAAQDPAPPVTGSMTPDELSRALDGYIGEMAAADRFSGAVLIAKNGAPVYRQAFGLADREARVANTVSTRFNLASINKLFTRVAVLQLVAAGKLTLADTVGHLLPDHPNSQAKAATVDQLLNHRGGIPDFFGPAFADAAKSQFHSNADYYRFIAPRPLLFEPGTQTRYCNGCYIVLGAIVERVSGMAYEDYIAQRVFAPAGMTGAGFFHTDRLPPDTAIGYMHPRPPLEPGGPPTAGGGAEPSRGGPEARGGPESRGALEMRGGPGSRGGPESPRDGAGGPPPPMPELHGPVERNTAAHGVAGSAAGGSYASVSDLLAFDTALRAGRLLDAKMTAAFLAGDRPPGRTDASGADAGGPGAGRPGAGGGVPRMGFAGGAPGINGVMESDGVWTVIVLGNGDPPLPGRLGTSIARQLGH
jgi:CubicO group peptidase (beta-lactamase class C family)